MKLTRRRCLRTLGGLVAAGSGFLLEGFARADFQSDQQKEQFLRSARIVSTEEIGHGVTSPRKATMEWQGSTHAASIQVVDLPLGDFFGADGTTAPMRDCWRFNVAAYKVDRLIGLKMVVVTVARNFQTKPAGFSWWVDDVMGEEIDRIKQGWVPPDQKAFDEARAVVQVFDELIINIDRNLSNLLITKSWDLALIDHSRSFIPYKGIRNTENLKRCSRALLKEMRAMKLAAVQNAVGTYLTSREVSALMSRRDRIVEFFDAKIKADGEENVLF
jgi:hypothetical protein